MSPIDHLERALDAQPHHHLGADAEIAQVMRQLIGARIELTVAEAVLLEHHRDGVGAPGDLGLEQLRQGRGGNRMGGVVPLPQDGVALLSRENVEAADRPLRLRHRRLQQPNQPTCQRRNARPVEQVGGVFEYSVDPRRLAVRAALLCEAERQVELGAGSVNRFNDSHQPRQLQACRRVVLQRQHHLEQRMPRQRAGRVEHLHQPLERQVLMAVGSKTARAHPRDQLAEARIAGRVGAQHQGVDEETDEIVEHAVGASRYRAADRDVGARTQPREQAPRGPLAAP